MHQLTFTTGAVVSSLLILFLSGQCQSTPQKRERSSETPHRYFTVRDSIEMVRFERGAEPIISPDKRYFAVVTSRGIIRSDEVESTLRVFKAGQVKESLRDVATADGVIPTVVATLAAVPTVDYTTSYQPIISNLRWSSDSKALLFLAQNSRKERQLYRADLASASFRAVTHPGYDVSQFEARGEMIVYRAARSQQGPDAGEAINSDARNVSGASLISILFGDKVQRYPPYSELWVHRKGRNRRVTDSATDHPVRLSNSPVVFPGLNPLSISPDGGFVVGLVPSDPIPKPWESYVPARESLKLDSTNSSSTRADFDWTRPTAYTLVDLDNGKVTSILNAPHAWALGYGKDRNLAVWSSDGNRLLLTNTYLPLDGVDEAERLRRLRPCAAAVVELVSKMMHCLRTAANGDALPLVNAFFSRPDNNQVVLEFGQKSTVGQNPTEERYVYDSGTWQRVALLSADQRGLALTGGTAADHIGLGTVVVEIRQDLNTPPTLWATDRHSGRSKRIWDPNPRMRSLTLGEASAFRWKDNTGYEWTGVLVKPPGYSIGKTYPLVIQTRGALEGEFLSDGRYTTAFAARPLAAAGILVLLMQYRSDNLGTADEVSDNVRGYEAAIETLASEGLVDTGKIGIIGFSRTAYHVESALIQNPRRFLAATIADGIDASYIQELLFFNGRGGVGSAIYGKKPFGEGLSVWMDRAPGFHLDRIQTPLRIEAIGPGSILAEWEIYASLWAQGKPVELIYFPDGQHILQKPLERMASQQGNVDWFRFWLKGEEDMDPMKAQQYSRWKELRNRHVGKDQHQ